MTFEDLEVRDKFKTALKEFITSFMLDAGRYYFLLDEFHYVKNGGQRLKLLYDTVKNAKFVITGSSSLELRGETAAYLVGRMFSFEFFDILQQTYIVDAIKPYHRNLVTELRKNPKIYFTDTGLRNYLLYIKYNFHLFKTQINTDLRRFILV